MEKIVWPKLPKDFKRRWVAALRSGKYKQGTSYLMGFQILTLGDQRRRMKESGVDTKIIVDLDKLIELLRSNYNVLSYRY
jgi:hypothetical protein